MKRSEKSISSVAALLMLSVFSLSILGVLLSGGRIYKNLTQQGRDDYDRRTCLQYLSTKLNQAPSPDSVSIRPFGDGDALFITETIGDKEYVTRIYCHNGYLMELFSIQSDSFAPEDGEKLMPLSKLSVTQSGTLLTLQAASGDALWTVCHTVRGAQS